MIFAHNQIGGDQLVFKDERLNVFPVRVQNADGEVCFSYVCQPKIRSQMLIPSKAEAIPGLVPRIHYKVLIAGENVTLDDGTVVTPD